MATQVAIPAAIRRPGRLAGVVLVLVLWLLGWALFRGRDTLPLAPSDTTWVHERINDFNDSLSASRNSNPIFLYFFNEIRLVIDHLVTGLQALIKETAADELMVASAIYDHAARLRSYEILSEVRGTLRLDQA